MYHSSGNWASEHIIHPDARGRCPTDQAGAAWRAWSAACAGAGHSAIVRMMALRHWLATGTPHAHAHMRSARSSLVLFAVSVSCLPTDKQQRRRQHRTRRVEGPDVCTRLVHATQHPLVLPSHYGWCFWAAWQVFTGAQTPCCPPLPTGHPFLCSRGFALRRSGQVYMLTAD